MFSNTSPRPLAARLWRAALSFFVVMALVVHVVAGWMFSGRIIDEAFTPPPELEFGRVGAATLPIETVQYDSRESLDYVRRLEGLSVPTLVFHGTDDVTVPIEVSRAMAEVRPQLIDVVEVEGGGHVASREATGTAYDQRVLAFLQAHWR